MASRTEFATEYEVQFWDWAGVGEGTEWDERERDVRWPKEWREEGMRVSAWTGWK